MKRPDPHLLRLIVFIGALLGVLVILIAFREIFLPLLLGFLAAYLFDPMVSGLERRRVPRWAGAILIGLGLVLAMVLTLLYILPTLSDQLQALAQRLPHYSQRLRSQLEPYLAKLQARYPEQVEKLRESLMAAARSNFSTLAGTVGMVAQTAFSSVLEFALAILNMVFVPVFAFYLMVDLPHIKQGIADLIPRPYRTLVIARLGEVDQAISSFLRGQLTIALILASINSLGLTLLGVPLGLGIGIIAGLANMVPYMSLVIGLVPALLLCWAEWQSPARLAGVVAVFGGGQLFEGTILSPRILSMSINLHPVWVLLAILVGGNLFGFFGMLLAVPVAAAIQVFARHWIRTYRESAIYRGESHPPQTAAAVALGAAPLPAQPANPALEAGQSARKTGKRGRRR